mgnify:FL=1
MKNVNLVRLVFIVLSATVVFAVYGYVSYYGYAFDDAIYKTLQLFTIGAESVPEQSLAINIARFLAPIVVVCGGIQFVYFISQNGWKQLCLWGFKKHIIICGYGTTGKLFFEKSKGKQFIVIDPLIENPKVSFSKIFLNKDASDRNVLVKDAKINKASEIIIATGSDYINMLIYDIAQEYDNIGALRVRLEQLDNSDSQNEMENNRTRFFNLSEIVVRKFKQYDNQLIVVTGIGNVGKRVVDRYKNTNKILVIEQSMATIHMAQDIYNSPNIKYERADVRGLIESDLIRILEKYNLQQFCRITLFICLGGDWLGFSTAWKWLSWTKIALDINLIGTDINKNLLRDKGKNRINIYNINDVGEVIP